MKHPAAPRAHIFGPVALGPAILAAPAVATAISATSAVVGVAGLGLSVLGSMKAAQQSSMMSNYQRRIASNNQILAERAAQQTEALGENAKTEAAAKTRALIGRQRTQFAANGVLVDSGSALGTTEDTAGLGMLDQLNIDYNTKQKAAAIRYQGAQYGSEAGYDTSVGFDYGGTLSQVGQVASKWYDFGDSQGWFTPGASNSGGAIGSNAAARGF